MNGKNSSGKWQLVTVIVSIIFGILGVVVGLVQTKLSYDLQGQAISLSEKNLELQNMLSNSTPIIVTNPEQGHLDEQGYYSNITASYPTVSRGWLNGSLTVITPHYGNVTIEIINFTVSDYFDMLVPERANLTTVASTLEYNYSKHVDYVIQGLNQLTFSINLEAMFYPNPQKLPSMSDSYSVFPIGVLFLEAKLFDAQTNLTFTQVSYSIVFVTVRIL